jgi:hypothetical protein
MAIDFPIPSVIGQKHPVTPIEGVPTYTWDGEKWITGLTSGSAFVAKAGDTMTGPLVLPADPTVALQAATKQYVDGKRVRYDVAGVAVKDIQVPAGATAARITGMLWTTTTTPSFVGVQLSVSPGVFRNTVGDYVMSGFYHYSAGTVIGNHSFLNALTLMQITPQTVNITVPMLFDGYIQTKRYSTAQVFALDCRCSAFSGSGSMSHEFLYHWLGAASAGSQLDVLAIRFLSTIGEVLGAGSFITVEWL